MSIELGLFIALGTLSLIAAIGVIAARSAFTSAVFLILLILCLAAIYVLLNAPFIAAAQVLVYAGAIMVLFLFVIMMFGLREDEAASRLKFQRPLGLLLGLALLLEVGFAVGVALLRKEGVAPAGQAMAFMGDIQALGRALLTDYLLAFEAVSLLLLVAIVGAVVLGKRRL
jgi:NADH-quinone oxidoreductase subunit J